MDRSRAAKLVFFEANAASVDNIPRHFERLAKFGKSSPLGATPEHTITASSSDTTLVPPESLKVTRW